MFSFVPGVVVHLYRYTAEYVNRSLFHTASVHAPPDGIPRWSVQLTAIIAGFLVTKLFCYTLAWYPTRCGVYNYQSFRHGESVPNPPLCSSSRFSTGLSIETFMSLLPRIIHFSMFLVMVRLSSSCQSRPKVLRTYRRSCFRLPILPTLSSLTRYVISFSGTITLQPYVKDTVARSNIVVFDFGRALFGPLCGVFFAVMVAIPCFRDLSHPS